jgi:hypothetical protein
MRMMKKDTMLDFETKEELAALFTVRFYKKPDMIFL